MKRKLIIEVDQIKRGPHEGRWIWSVGYTDEIVPGFGCFFVEASSRPLKRNDPDDTGTYEHRHNALLDAQRIRESLEEG